VEQNHDFGFANVLGGLSSHVKLLTGLMEVGDQQPWVRIGVDIGAGSEFCNLLIGEGAPWSGTLLWFEQLVTLVHLFLQFPPSLFQHNPTLASEI
jgi:hypothetical protein